MNTEFDRYMYIIAGGTDKKAPQQTLDKNDQNNIAKAYFQLFNNLCAVNWLRGGSLGQAWYTTLNQIKQFIAAKNPKNPSVMYMRQIFAAHNTKMSQMMMTGQHRDDEIIATPQQRQEWNMRVAPNVTNAMNAINAIIAKYNVREQSATSAKMDYATALKIIIQKQMIGRSRAA